MSDPKSPISADPIKSLKELGYFLKRTHTPITISASAMSASLLSSFIPSFHFKKKKKVQTGLRLSVPFWVSRIVKWKDK